MELEKHVQELIDWPVSNEHRVDILYDLAISRFHKAHIQSLKTRSPLPANERCQYRWNAVLLKWKIVEWNERGVTQELGFCPTGWRDITRSFELLFSCS